jgi:hypothetical protein
MTKVLYALILVAATAGVLWVASDYFMPESAVNTVGQNPPNSAEGAPEGSIHNLPVPEAVAAVRSYAAVQHNTTEEKVLIETAFEKEWPDGCLGLAQPDEFCTQALVPGWEVTVLVNGESVVYRTNTNGSVIREE